MESELGFGENIRAAVNQDNTCAWPVCKSIHSHTCTHTLSPFPSLSVSFSVALSPPPLSSSVFLALSPFARSPLHLSLSPSLSRSLHLTPYSVSLCLSLLSSLLLSFTSPSLSTLNLSPLPPRLPLSAIIAV